MFGRTLAQRVKKLEERIARMEQKELCAEGRHKWVMAESYTGREPYIKCSECYALPKSEQKP